MRYRVVETFEDYDGITVQKGVVGKLELKGFSEINQKHFWNLEEDGRVLAVTLGRPPVERVDQ